MKHRNEELYFEFMRGAHRPETALVRAIERVVELEEHQKRSILVTKALRVIQFIAENEVTDHPDDRAWKQVFMSAHIAEGSCPAEHADFVEIVNSLYSQLVIQGEAEPIL